MKLFDNMKNKMNESLHNTPDGSPLWLVRRMGELTRAVYSVINNWSATRAAEKELERSLNVDDINNDDILPRDNTIDKDKEV